MDAADGVGQPRGALAADRAGDGEGRLALRLGDGLALVRVEHECRRVGQRHGHRGDAALAERRGQTLGARHAEVVVMGAVVMRLGRRVLEAGVARVAAGVAALPRERGGGRAVAQTALVGAGRGHAEHVERRSGGTARGRGADEQRVGLATGEHMVRSHERVGHAPAGSVGAEREAKEQRARGRRGKGTGGAGAGRGRCADEGAAALRTSEDARIGSGAAHRRGTHGQHRASVVGAGGALGGVAQLVLVVGLGQVDEGGRVGVGSGSGGGLGVGRRVALGARGIVARAGGRRGGETARGQRQARGLGGEHLLGRPAETDAAGQEGGAARGPPVGLRLGQIELAVEVLHALDLRPRRMGALDLGGEPVVIIQRLAAGLGQHGHVVVVGGLGRAEQHVEAPAFRQRAREVARVHTHGERGDTGHGDARLLLRAHGDEGEGGRRGEGEVDG